MENVLERKQPADRKGLARLCAGQALSIVVATRHVVFTWDWETGERLGPHNISTHHQLAVWDLQGRLGVLDPTAR